MARHTMFDVIFVFDYLFICDEDKTGYHVIQLNFSGRFVLKNCIHLWNSIENKWTMNWLISQWNWENFQILSQHSDLGRFPFAKLAGHFFWTVSKWRTLLPEISISEEFQESVLQICTFPQRIDRSGRRLAGQLWQMENTLSLTKLAIRRRKSSVSVKRYPFQFF